MSTVRIQVRRGTASQWTSVNPILAAGEMGVESDTNLFKFGNGSSTWTALAYANNSDVAIGEISQDAINAALSLGSGLTKTYNDGANTITINVDSDIVALKSYVDSQITGLSNTVDTDFIPVSDRGSALGVASLNASGKVPTSELDFEGIQDSLSSFIEGGNGVATSYNDAGNKLIISDNKVAGDGIEFADVNGQRTIKLAPSITGSTSILTPALTVTSTADVAALTTTGNASVGGNLTITGNLTVNGTATSVNSTNYTIDDPMIYVGEGNQSNVLDLGLVGAFNNGTYQHAGLVRDASDGKWKLFSGVTAEPGTTVDFTTYTKDTLEVGALSADAAKIGDTTNTEIQYLHGVRSSVQTQLDSKTTPEAAAQAAAAIYAPIASPTFTGTVTLPESTVSSSMIAAGAVGTSKLENNAVDSSKIANNTIVDGDISTTANISATKIAGTAVTAADTGSVTNTMLAGEIAASKLAGSIPQSKIVGLENDLTNLNNSVTTNNTTTVNAINSINDAIQTNNTNTVDALADKAPLDAPTFTGTVVLPSTTSIGNVSATEIGHLDGVTSSIQTQIASLSTADSTHAALTTNVHGIADTAELATKTYADAIGTTATNALALKAPLANPTFTGTVTGVTKSHVGLGNVDNTADSAKPVSTAQQTALDLKANLAAPTFTGTVSAANLTLSGNLTVNGTTTTVSSTNLEITDPLIYIGTGNSANANDLGIVGHFNDGTYQHTGLARDASDGKWKLFSGVTTEPTGTVDFTTWTKDTLVTGPIEATTVTPSSGVVFTDGTQTKEGIPSRTQISAKTADYTLSALTERDSLIEINSASAVTVTVPQDSTLNYPIGTSIDILRVGAGAVTVAAGSGVTLNYTPGNKLRAQWSGATLFKRAANTWVVYGDLSA
jgi:hypothetical protein